MRKSGIRVRENNTKNISTSSQTCFPVANKQVMQKTQPTRSDMQTYQLLCCGKNQLCRGWSVISTRLLTRDELGSFVLAKTEWYTPVCSVEEGEICL
jgi:hypothetical protein